MFDLTACHVERLADDNYLLRWHCYKQGERVAVYMAEDPDLYYRGGNPGTPLMHTTGEEAIVHNTDPGVRHYFYLQTDSGEGVILAERKLSLRGTPNFRDLGGYQTECGSRLKWGKLYRSSKLSGLTETDTGYVHRLGLTLICDFRQALEQELEPSLLHPLHTAELASLPVTPGSSHSFIENLHKGIIAVDDAAGFMEEINRDFVVNQLPQYAEMFQLILREGEPVLIHCASGKDRTGFGAALILDVLGVGEESIVEDYLLTNKYLPVEEEIAKLSGQFRNQTGELVSDEVLRPMFELRPEYIRACFEEIRRRYDSKEHFYESALKLDAASIRRLKEKYLE